MQGERAKRASLCDRRECEATTNPLLIHSCSRASLKMRTISLRSAQHANRKRFQSNEVGGLSFFVFQRVMLGEGVGKHSIKTIELLESDILDIESCFIGESVFGTNLEGVLRKELFTRSPAAAMPPPGSLLMNGKTGVPIILQLLCKTIMELGAEKCEGIFRLAALKDDIDWAITEIKGGDYRPINCDVVSKVSVTECLLAADLLKTWLRQMSERLFGYELYEKCVAVGRSRDGSEAVAILKLLRPANRACVVFLCRFLKKLSLAHNVTKMTSENLALVFAPNLLKSEGDDPMSFALNSDAEKRFLLYLIENVE